MPWGILYWKINLDIKMNNIPSSRGADIYLSGTTYSLIGIERSLILNIISTIPTLVIGSI